MPVTACYTVQSNYIFNMKPKHLSTFFSLKSYFETKYSSILYTLMKQQNTTYRSQLAFCHSLLFSKVWAWKNNFYIPVFVRLQEFWVTKITIRTLSKLLWNNIFCQSSSACIDCYNHAHVVLRHTAIGWRLCWFGTSCWVTFSSYPTGTPCS